MTEFSTDRSDALNAGWFAFGPYLVCPGERTLKRNGQLLQIGDKALGTLGAREREAIIVLGINEASQQELAHESCEPVGTLKSRLCRGRAHLKSALDMAAMVLA